jgi:glycosyltransferase involved in cell wall biosynthesis
LKILHVIVGLDVGGAELMLKRLIEAHQKNSNYKHSVLSLTDIGTVGKQLKALNVEVHALKMTSIFELPLVFFRLIQFLRYNSPDIVQTWMYHSDLLGGLAARLIGNRRIIWGIRTTDVSSGCSSVTAAIRKVCALLSNWVPETIVCAAQASCDAHIRIGYKSSKMKVIANGFDLSRLVADESESKKLRNNYSLIDREIVIGSIGRFNSDKDQHNFVKAAGLLVATNPKLRFLMVGRDLVASNPELMSWIRETGFSKHFILLGERSDVPVCLSAMDIFCLHSRTEGFPNVLGEAMAMGLPCVTTEVGDAALLMGDTGILVPKEDAKALSTGIQNLLDMKSKDRDLLGGNARSRIRDKFSLVRTVEQYEVIYNDLKNKGSC